MRDKRWFGRIIAVLMTLIMSVFCLAGCGSGSEPVGATPEEEEPEEIVEEEVEETPEKMEPWDYFETVNCIGRSYEQLSSEYDLLENGAMDGGVIYRVNGETLSIGFPAASTDELSPDDECTAMYGTLRTLFGIEETVDIDELNTMLMAHCEADISGEDATYYGISDYQNSKYNIVIYAGAVGEPIDPDAGVRIGYNN